MTVPAKILQMATLEQPTAPEPKNDIRDLPDDDAMPVQAFDPDLLPDSVRGFVVDTADRMQCPIDFLAVTAMVGAGALVGRKVLMKPKQLDNWTIAPNLWGANIGRPSAMKSPAINAALQPLRNFEQEQQADHREIIKEIEVQKALMQAGADDRKKRMKEAAKTKNMELAREIMAEESVQEAPTLPRLIVNNATIEKLGELLAQSNNGLLLERDELAGWLANLNSKDGGEDRAFYLELYDRLTPYTFDRIMRGTTMIDHPILSIVGGIQPSKIAGVVRGAVSGEMDDGLIQRFQLMVWPDNEESFSYRDRAPEPRAYAAYMGMMRRLSELPIPEGKAPAWNFTDRAQAAFVEWYTATMQRARSGEIGSAIESHLIKSPKAIAGLALLLELLDGGTSGTAGETATLRALAWAEYLESHARRVYSAGTASATAAAKTILHNKAKLSEVFTAREVWKKGWKGVTQDITEDALDLLIDCGYLMASTTDTGASGRPTTRFTWRA
ncbi:YfjI family protein [Candidatus Thiothrix sp. Deng01]|uniref:YfjI family protein n=1 Tax=Candidatus Thiothrix phosphatis TaxID=3112415 RepID=A0ABU6CTB1_9GAMM|nr:YfjI family protein [Candidatus Thiothrix sp. Deng01]MEB4590034.1 YfjI family protein [Candidatus Thiothrix sp. Deng01]